MTILRTIRCDICGEEETEKDMGAGWQGWAIVQGIGASVPEPGESLKTEHTQLTLCPNHTGSLALAIAEIRKVFISEKSQ